MEESFELLSTMSPQVKGRQKTIKTKKVSRLGLKRHFRRSAIFDKAPPVRNEDLSIVELTSESGESFGSKEFNDMKNAIVVNSSDSEEEPELNFKPCSSEVSSKTEIPSSIRVHQWLDNVEQNEKAITFFSQVSTIYDDGEGPKTDKSANLVAACSSFNDYLTHRFDELFINKNTDGKPEVPLVDEETFESNEGSGRNSKNKPSVMTPVKEKNLMLGGKLKVPLVHEETFDTFKSNDVSGSSNNKRCVKSPVRKESIMSDRFKTPVNKTVKEVESMLDTLYGNSWRKNQHRVLSPMTQPKDRKITETTTKLVTSSAKHSRPQLKKPQFEVGCLDKKIKKPNLDNLRKPFESPWMKKFEGLVDSPSDDELESKLFKGLDEVRTKLIFDDHISKQNHQSSNKNFTNEKKGKENIPLNVNIKKANKKTVCENQTEKKSYSKSDSSEDDVSTDDEYDQEIKKLEIRRQSILPVKNKTYTFLESLSATVPLNKCDMTARIFRSSFKQNRDKLAERLFRLFNEKVFDNALPKDTNIEWNVKLRKTAGLCYCSKITHRSGLVTRKARISLSTKVLDIPCRLRDTLIHEMCHAAAWIINQVSNGHGPYWKSWAFKAMEVFPELPPIKRCHSYAITSKYTYKCTGCGYSFGRHSKSLDIERKRCGHCLSKFEILINKTTKQGGTKTVSATSRKEPTAFALFVKENYALYKDPARKHGDVMKMLGEKFSELKVQKGS